MNTSVVPNHNNCRHLSHEEVANNIGGLPVTDDRFQQLFASLDVNHTDSIPIPVAMQYFKGLENYGLEVSDAELEATLRKRSNTVKDALVYQEFACLLLERARS